MTETIGVLVVFFILILFGFIFYAQYQKGAIKEQQKAVIAKRAVAVSLKTFYLPELRCTKGFDVGIPACIDLKKLEILEDQIDNNYNFYSALFGKSDIYVDIIIDQERIELYNATPSGPVDKISIKFPISIYDVTTPGTYGELIGVTKFGVLNVDIYE